MELELAAKIAGGITAIIASVFALRKFLKWLFPIHIEPKFRLNIDGTKQDSIGATVTNRGSEPLYIIECYARGTYSFNHILRQHIKKPFLRPSLYQNVWYGGPVYSLLHENSVKLDSGQPLYFDCQIYEHPGNAMLTPYFVVMVKLSSGRTFRSNKLQAPGRWRYIGRRHLQST